MSRFDVIIPAFNAARYLHEALDSVLAQRAYVARIVVVDDGSTDDTAAIAAAYGAPVELLKHAGNSGIARARNTGVAACTAPLLAFLDADDRWLPGTLAAQLAALEDEPAKGFALCRIRHFASPELPPDERAALLAAHPAEVEGWMPSAMVVRRDVCARVGPFAIDLAVGETIDWFNRARGEGHVSHAHVGVERRLHRDNTTRRLANDRTGYLHAAHRELMRRRAANVR